MAPRTKQTKRYSDNVTVTIRIPAQLVNWVEDKVGAGSRGAFIGQCVARAKADEEAERITIPELLDTLRGTIKAMKQARHLLGHLVERKKHKP